MKRFLSRFVVLIDPALYTWEYCDATVVFTDGKFRTGLVRSPFGGNCIFFKTANDTMVQMLETALISKIIFTIGSEQKEYHQLKVYLDKAQELMSDPIWLEVVEKGITTLYVNQTSLSGVNGLSKTGFADYFVLREGEGVASRVENGG